MLQKTKKMIVIILIIATTMQLHTQDHDAYKRYPDASNDRSYRIKNHLVYDAVTKNNIPVLTYLLENLNAYSSDAVLGYQDAYGNTSLIIAVYNHNETITEMLMEKGANVNTQNSVGVTPMHIAARNQNVAIMNILLRIDLSNILSTPLANPNIQDQHGRTPLHYAAYNLNHRMISDLWKHGADPHIKDRQESSSIDLFRARIQRK